MGHIDTLDLVETNVMVSQRVALRVNGAVRWLATDHPSAGDLQSPLRAGVGSTAGGLLPRMGCISVWGRSPGGACTS